MIICKIQIVCQKYLNEDVLCFEENLENYYKKNLENKKYFICSRNCINELLKKYYKVEKYKIKYSNNGKPKIILENGKQIFLSISNKDKYCVVAIGDVEIGIDFEKINEKINYQKFVKRFNAKLKIENVTQFYFYWTLLESYIKLFDLQLFNSFELDEKQILKKINILKHEIYNEKYVICVISNIKCKIIFINNG